MYLYHINIGSNIGDSRSLLERAVAAVSGLSRGVVRRSSVVESEPWGFDSLNKFLNVGMEISSQLPPEALLERLQAIERSISPQSHRNPDGSYRDRLIDIDMIFAARCTGEIPDAVNEEAIVRLETPELTLPHPRAWQRGFVTAPILELHPGFPLSALKAQLAESGRESGEGYGDKDREMV